MRRPTFLSVLLAVLLLVCGAALWAVESSRFSLGRNSGTTGQFSLRPLKLYSGRGRKDPFVAVMFYTPRPNNADLKISQLVLVGMIVSAGDQVALFQTNSGPEQTFLLKKGVLFSRGNQAISDIGGKILGSQSVTLRQGEQRLTFSTSR